MSDNASYPTTNVWIQIHVIRDGASWIAQARIVEIAGMEPVEDDPPWVDIGCVNGATEAEAMSAAEAIMRSARVELRHVD